MNFIKAKKEVLEEYGIEITTELLLPDGEHVKHFETSDPIWLKMRSDNRVAYLTDVEINKLKQEGDVDG